MTGPRDLRPHQQAGLDAIKASLVAGHRRIVFQAACGYGKTVLAAHMVHGALNKRKRMAFCVPSLGLIDQTFERFCENGVDPAEMGVIQGNHPWRRPHAPIQICSAQTLARRSLPEVDAVVIDEAHIQFKVYNDWQDDPAWAAVPFVALTATPWAKGMGKRYTDLIKPITMQELIDLGFLSPFRVFAPSHPDLRGVKTIAGDYHEGQLAAVMNKPKLVADIVNTWLEKADGRPTICFAVDCLHAQNVRDAFAAAGVSAAYIDADTPREERNSIGSALGAGDTKVVCSVGCLIAGIDWDVRCIIFARPTKSEILFVQAIGRGLRTADGKDHCIARDSLVLTDRGLVEIQNVTLDHKVWDGVSFVGHKGAVCKGVQKVITYDGVTATPDHRVMTDAGWQRIEEAARDGRRIARTGFGGVPLRFIDDHISQGTGQILGSLGRGLLRSLRGRSYDPLSQHAEATRYDGLSGMQWAATCDRAVLALSALSSPARSLLQSSVKLLRAIRRARDRVPLLRPECGGALDRGQSGHQGQITAHRSNRQQRTLRAGQPALVDASREHEQHEKIGRVAARQAYSLSKEASGDPLCGQNIEAHDPGRYDGQTDHCAVGDSIVQAEREVWDILDAGALQRFTVNGRLVHNCLILDHSDTTLRMGFVTDIDSRNTELDDGSDRLAKAKKEAEDELPLPRACVQCAALVPPKTRECPCCGHIARPKSLVETAAGELTELRTSTQRESGKPASSADLLRAMSQTQIWSEIRGLQIERGRSEGWAAHVYKSLFDVWPPRAWNSAEAMAPSFTLRGYVRARDIAYAKAKEAEKRRTLEGATTNAEH